MVGRVARQVYVFPSELGWMTGLWHADTLIDFWFGQPTRTAALSRVGGASYDVARVLAEEDFQAAPERLHIPEPCLSAIQQLRGYASGEVHDLREIAIDLSGFTAFRRRVTEVCRAIPYGETRTYAELAAEVGAPRAARAVGNVMRTNRWPLIVPCHRVLGSSGGLGGYSAPEGLTMKKRLLALEARAVMASV